jgi:hypothetical protein
MNLLSESVSNLTFGGKWGILGEVIVANGGLKT